MIIPCSGKRRFQNYKSDVDDKAPEALPAIFGSDIWVKSELNLIYLSRIWVKKETKNARIRDISCFATKARSCSIRAWRRRIVLTPSTPNLAVTYSIPWKDCSLFQGHLYFTTKEYSLFLFKLTLLANDSDCLPKVCYLKLKKTQISEQTQIIWVSQGLWS